MRSYVRFCFSADFLKTHTQLIRIMSHRRSNRQNLRCIHRTSSSLCCTWNPINSPATIFDCHGDNGIVEFRIQATTENSKPIWSHNRGGWTSSSESRPTRYWASCSPSSRTRHTGTVISTGIGTGSGINIGIGTEWTTTSISTQQPIDKNRSTNFLPTGHSMGSGRTSSSKPESIQLPTGLRRSSPSNRILHSTRKSSPPDRTKFIRPTTSVANGSQAFYILLLFPCVWWIFYLFVLYFSKLKKLKNQFWKVKSEVTCFTSAGASTSMSTKPYVPREPRKDPSCHRLYEHIYGIWFISDTFFDQVGYTTSCSIKLLTFTTVYQLLPIIYRPRRDERFCLPCLPGIRTRVLWIIVHGSQRRTTYSPTHPRWQSRRRRWRLN